MSTWIFHYGINLAVKVLIEQSRNHYGDYNKRKIRAAENEHWISCFLARDIAEKFDLGFECLFKFGSRNMEREAKNREECRSPEPDFLVHWGRNKKRQRTIKAKDDINSDPKKQIVRMARSNEESSISRLSKSNFLQQQQQQTKPSCIQRKTHLQEHGEIQKERGYSTRSSGFPANNNLTTEAHELHLPKFSISLNVKEMDEDFMTIAGLKLHRRPKKRLKFIQRMIDFISPAACLPDSITVESYEVQEEKSYKKKPRGLKAMVLANTESDSE